MHEWNPLTDGLRRTSVINALIEKHRFQSYLEIGVAEGTNFRNVRGVKIKHGVDPDPDSQATHRMNSDQFFKINRNNFDLIFLDGLHFHEQLYRDIIHSLKILNKDGIIVCHDINPKTEKIQRRSRSYPCWRGDVWKAWVRLRMSRRDLQMYAIEYPLVEDIQSRYGGDDLGFIRFGSQEVLEIGNRDLTWRNLSVYRKSWLNIVTEPLLPSGIRCSCSYGRFNAPIETFTGYPSPNTSQTRPDLYTK